MKIHKRLLAGALVMLTGITMCGSPAQADPSDSEPVEKVLAKSSNGNPLFRLFRCRYSDDYSDKSTIPIFSETA